MSETPQEILDRAAPIWDRHVVSFTLVLAALRSVLAERDALREAHRKLGVLYQGTTQVVDALMDDVQSTGKLWHEAESRLEQARIDRDEAISQCVSIGRESKKLEAERDALRAEVAQAEGVARGYMLAAEKAEAALLDAQHQEALDIEALDKLGNAYDAAATAWGRDEAEYIRTVARLREAQHAAVVGWDKDRAEVERLRAEGLAIADGQIADRERLEAEVARLRDIIAPGDAAAYEEGMAALQARERALEGALREWREAESWPDCAACSVLDAALAGAKP